MTTAISLHLGLNRIDPAHYDTEGILAGCINDATAMEAIASASGFRTTLWTDEQATTTAVRDFLEEAGRELASGDTLLVTMAGHGSTVPDLNNDESPNTVDQTWCLFDRMMVDDELAEIWSTFRPGVRIILVSDTCFSGDVARAFQLLAEVSSNARGPLFAQSARLIAPLIGDTVANMRVGQYRALPLEARIHAHEQNRALYTNIQQQTRGSEQVEIAASVMLLSACKEDELAWDSDRNGFYTAQLLNVWNNGSFQGTYREFQNQIAAAVGDRQRPQYKIVGAVNTALEQERPFTIASVVAPPRETEPQPTTPCPPDPSIKDRLARLQVGSRDRPETVRLELAVPRDYFKTLSPEEALEFLSTHGADTLMKAVLEARPNGDGLRHGSAELSGDDVTCRAKVDGLNA